MKLPFPQLAASPVRWLAIALFAGGAAADLHADVVIIETRDGGQNLTAYNEGGGNWLNSSAKSSAPGTTGARAGSRFATLDGSTFSVSPVLGNPGGEYLVEVTHGVSANIPIDLQVSVGVTGGTGLPTSTSAFDQTPANVWRTVGTLSLNAGVTTPTITFAKLTGASGSGQRIYADAVRFTFAGDPCLSVPQLATVNGPLAEGQTFVNVPGVLSNAAAVVVYADGTEIGRRTADIDGGLEQVTSVPLLKNQVITATQIDTNGVESCRPTTGARVGGGANPRIRVSLSLRQNPELTGPIGANGGATNTTVVFLGATNVFGGGFALAPVGGKIFTPDACWQTVTFQRGEDPANPIDPTYAWAGATGTSDLLGDFGVVDAIAFAIDDLTDTGPFRVYLDEFRNGGVLIQGFENATNRQNTVMFSAPGFSGSTSPFLLAQTPGSISPNLSQVTDEFADRGNHSLAVSWQFKDLAGGNWLRLVAQGSETPNAQVDLRQPISFRLLLLPAGVTNPPLQICLQPEPTTGLQSQPAQLAVSAVGTQPLTYQWFRNGVALPGATNETLHLTAAAPSDSGLYHVVVSDVTGSLTSSNATLMIEPAAFTDLMEPWWNLAPDDRLYLAPDGQQSGLAYNPVSGNLLLVTRTGGDAVILLDGSTGAEVGALSLDPFDVFGGLHLVNKVRTTSDGSVFVGNLTTNAALDPFKIYYWTADTPGAIPAGTLWQGNPDGTGTGRWGDTLALREIEIDGSPLPEFAVAAYDDNRIAVLRLWTTDMVFTLGDVPPGAFNHGLAWGEGDTLWGKSYQGDLYHVGLDLTNGTAELLHVFTNLPSLAAIDINLVNHYLGAISIASPDSLRLFDLSRPAEAIAPLDTEPFLSDNPGSPAGAVAFGPGRVYALNPNHGILALRLRPLLRTARQQNLLTLEWTGPGTLQSAPAAIATFDDLTGAASPYTVDMSTNTQRFFRLRE